MSTSSLLQSAASSDTLELHPPRPAPRRTYGRARPASPPPAEALSSLATSAQSDELIDRWSKSNKSFNDIMSNLDAVSSDQADEVDEEEVRREMERMRRQRRGERATDVADPRTPLIETQASSTSRVSRDTLFPPKPRSSALFGSSSLTSIPTAQASSPLRSSPPVRSPSPRPTGHAPLQAQSSETAEETMWPVRKSGLSGKPKRIVMSDDDDDEEDDLPPFPQENDRSPSPDHVSTTERGSSPSPHRESSLLHGQGEADEEEDRQDISDYINELAVEEEQEEARKAEEAISRSSPFEGLKDLFEDEDNETPQDETKKKGRVSRGLNKHDRDLVNKDIARAAREKPVYVSRPSPERMPISAWLNQANIAVKAPEPRPRPSGHPGQLQLQARATSASPLQPVSIDADEISAFTPSSAPREPLTGNSKPSVANVLSSPTPVNRKGKGKSNVVVPGTSDAAEEGDTENQDIGSFLAEETQREDAEQAHQKMLQKMLQEKQRRLLEFKLKQLHARAPPAKLHLGPAKSGSDDELDFEQEEVTPKKEVKQIVQAVKTGRGGAKGVLFKDSAQPSVSRQRQMILQRAGKSARSRHPEEVSETYIDIAGKAFKHSDQKQMNAGSKPVGQKQGRDTALTPQAVDAYIKQSHQRQVAAIQRKKEEDYGRTRRLPQRVEQEVEVIVEASKPEAEDASDEEAEDGDYVPDEEGEEGDERMVWSGEEAEEDPDQEEAEGEEDGMLEVGEGSAKENEPVPSGPPAEDEDEEGLPSFKRKPRASRRAIDSDDEDSLPRPQAKSSPVQRTPLREVPTPQPQATLRDAGEDGFGEIDFGGFGSGGGGSPGFSQLFGATQAGDDGAVQDAFAAMRAQEPIGLLPMNAALPSVDISRTQIDRDNALIAAELEDAAMDRMHEAEAPKKQYINERGLFTQTKPATLQVSATQLSDDEDSQSPRDRRQLAGASSLLFAKGLNSTPLGKTPSPTQAGSTMIDAQEGRLPVGSPSPTQTQEESFSRLRRRQSDPEQDSISLSPTQPANAFQRLMAGSRQPVGVFNGQKKKLKSKMVDEQAEESDEDNGWGRMGDEDEEDEEGDDGYVEGLVDDQAIDEEEKRRQDEAAAEKNREIQMADDAKREAEARKITEGDYRRKKRGVDFYSDDEDDEDGKRKRWSKKQRRKRQLDNEDGLVRLPGEQNVFVKAYEEDLDSDDEDIEETPLSPGLDRQRRVYQDVIADDAAVEEDDGPRQPALTFRQTLDMVKQRAAMNRGKTTAEIEAEDAIDRDDDIAADPSFGASRMRRNTFVDEPEDMEMDEAAHSGFSISRSASRSMSNIAAAADGDGDGENAVNSRKASKSGRSLASYASYVQEESQANRRAAGGASGVSVVRQASTGGSGNSNGRMGPPDRPAPVPHPHRQSTASSSSSGSILLSKGSGFA
ncbi:hypothetical protein I317_02931 [Kwoniella heveanensis CBS 569]|nr:hypothetical protein I317_02931 [Kwoniella heveanensis CBS 569]